MKIRRKEFTEAWQFVDSTADTLGIYQWVEQNTKGSFDPLSVLRGEAPWPNSGVAIDPRDGRMIISCEGAWVWVDLGDWVVREEGKFRVLKPSAFDLLYEVVPDEDLELVHRPHASNATTKN